MNSRRMFTALLIIAVAYVYFSYVGLNTQIWSHVLFGVIILSCMTIAFLTRKRDITVGILYGLVIVLCTLVVKFAFFVSVN